MVLRISTFVGARLMLVGVFAFVFPLIAAAQPRGSTEKVRITYAANNLGFLQMFLAKDRGFYAAQGLETELIRVSPVAVGFGAVDQCAGGIELLVVLRQEFGGGDEQWAGQAGFSELARGAW